MIAGVNNFDSRDEEIALS